MIDRSPSPGQERQGGGGVDDMDTDETQSNPPNVPGPETIAAARRRAQEDRENARTRSPTPPRALFRSTTGKGVAFTEEDVTFLVRFMEFKKFVFISSLVSREIYHDAGLKDVWIWSHFGRT